MNFANEIKMRKKAAFCSNETIALQNSVASKYGQILDQGYHDLMK